MDQLLVAFYGEVHFSENNKEPVPREIMPFPGCEMVFYLKGSATLNTAEGLVPLPAQFILGQSTATRSYFIEPGSTIFFIRVKQAILKSLLQDTGTWRDTLFLLTDKFPEQVCTHLLSMAGKNNFDERVAVAQKSISFFNTLQPDNNFEWLQTIELAIREKRSVAAMAKATHTTVRQLERKFKTYFDVSPKDFIRIHKLTEALDHYARNANSSVTDASYEGGFADQSHFIKTFKLFAREAPLKFFRKYNIKKT
jgi:AraC-like DNA-binding protein